MATKKKEVTTDMGGKEGGKEEVVDLNNCVWATFIKKLHWMAVKLI